MAPIYDIAGFDNVCSFIQASQKSKFSVYRQGQSGYNIPVFESTQHENVNNALQDFKAFAQIINKGCIYKLILFNEMEEVGIMGEGTGKKLKRKAGKNEILFIIDPQAIYSPLPERGNLEKYQAPAPQINVSELRESIVNEITKKQEESAVLKLLQDMDTRIKAMEINALEDEDEDEDEDELSGDKMGAMLSNVMLLAKMLKGGQPEAAPVINGPEAEAEAEAAAVDPKIEKVNKLNNAIKRLYKHDPNLHNTLNKLADIAEQKTDTFKFLLQNLDNL